MTDMNDLVPSLKREVAPPGQYAALYPGSTDAELVGYLMDAMAWAQLEGYLLEFTGDVDAGEVSPDLTPAGQALTVLYAAERILTNQILNMQMALRVAAGPVKYEIEKSANVMTEVLRQLQARRDRITESVTGVGGGTATLVYTRDAYLERVITGWPGYLALGATVEVP